MLVLASPRSYSPRSPARLALCRCLTMRTGTSSVRSFGERELGVARRRPTPTSNQFIALRTSRLPRSSSSPSSPADSNAKHRRGAGGAHSRPFSCPSQHVAIHPRRPAFAVASASSSSSRHLGRHVLASTGGPFGLPPRPQASQVPTAMAPCPSLRGRRALICARASLWRASSPPDMPVL